MPRMSALVSENHILFAIIEQLDQPARQHHMTATTAPATLPPRRSALLDMLPMTAMQVGLALLLEWAIGANFYAVLAGMLLASIHIQTGKRLDAEQRAAGITLALRNAAQAMRNPT